jgi:hypothetical protein
MCCVLSALQLDRSVILDLVVIVLGTQLLHAVHHTFLVPTPRMWLFLMNGMGSLSDGEIWTAHGGVNPCGLVVRRGGV